MWRWQSILFDLMNETGMGGIALTRVADDSTQIYGAVGVAGGQLCGRFVNILMLLNFQAVDLIRRRWRWIKPSHSLVPRQWTPRKWIQLLFGYDAVLQRMRRKRPQRVFLKVFLRNCCMCVARSAVDGSHHF
jgi:hypothetical protein